MGLAAPYQVADSRSAHHHFTSCNATCAFGVQNQLLGHDPLQRRGEHRTHLLLLVGREYVDHTVNCLWRVLCVKGTEHEVPGLRSSESHGDLLEVTHFTD